MYIMSLFTMPANATNRLKKLQRDFLWGGMGLDFAVSLSFLMVVVFERPLEQDEIRRLDLWALV